MPIIGDKHRFTRENVELAPEAPGVYALFENGQVAFYGRTQGGADTIRLRLSEHLEGRQAPAGVDAKLFSYEVTRFPASRERALLEEHHRHTRVWPTYNLPAR